MNRFRSSARTAHLPDHFFSNLVNKVNEVIGQGFDVINLGQGTPDRPTPPHIVASLQEASQLQIYQKYSPFDGLAELRAAIAHRYFEDYGVRLDPDSEVAVLFGGKTGLVELSLCLLDPGDICLLPDPGYPDYLSGVALAQAVPHFMPLVQSNQYLPDFTAIGEETWNKAKLMFLNYPNNPTAALAPYEFYEETVKLASKHGFAVASDFAYGSLGFDHCKPVSFLQIPGAKDVGVELYTLSKTYNMSGWRVAFVLGNREIVQQINRLQEHLFVSLFPAVQVAATTALLSSQDCVEQIRSMYESRRNALFGALNEIGWEAEKPRGSFFSWLPIPNDMNCESFCNRLLHEAKVMVAPGIGFGRYGSEYVRVGLLANEERLIEAVSRIEKLHFSFKRGSEKWIGSGAS
ncbi:aminotransferase class I/II-fold pyridoxal phosphate-dependent enzyme [Paenibacillus sp. GCM10027627]|uniref:aminotransferase class I/II-fold pyridoxal phosphate-dependent enzyme n=1 Tax=unclassified Paenibacillus TaxID=185978 RepID=UPI003627B187